jgi:hypothetical protein
MKVLGEGKIFERVSASTEVVELHLGVLVGDDDAFGTSPNAAITAPLVSAEVHLLWSLAVGMSTSR